MGLLMPEQKIDKRSFFGVQYWLPLVSVGVNQLYYVVQSRVTTSMEVAGEPSYRVAYVSNEILLICVAVQAVCIVVSLVIGLRAPTRVASIILAVGLSTIAVIVFCTQAWILPLVLYWMPCSHWGTQNCPI
jgi:hypothetical protein